MVGTDWDRRQDPYLVILVQTMHILMEVLQLSLKLYNMKVICQPVRVLMILLQELLQLNFYLYNAIGTQLLNYTYTFTPTSAMPTISNYFMRTDETVAYDTALNSSEIEAHFKKSSYFKTN